LLLRVATYIQTNEKYVRRRLLHQSIESHAAGAKVGIFCAEYIGKQGIVLLFLSVCNDFVDDFYKIPASLWHGAA